MVSAIPCVSKYGACLDGSVEVVTASDLHTYIHTQVQNETRNAEYIMFKWNCNQSIHTVIVKMGLQSQHLRQDKANYQGSQMV